MKSALKGILGMLVGVVRGLESGYHLSDTTKRFHWWGSPATKNGVVCFLLGLAVFLTLEC